jgi:hypothetical protein
MHRAWAQVGTATTLVSLSSPAERGEGWGEGHNRYGRQGQQLPPGVTASSPPALSSNGGEGDRVVGWWQCQCAHIGRLRHHVKIFLSAFGFGGFY